SLTQQCSQASGSSCTMSVIGASGEVNPLPRTPLTVVSARPTGACVGVSFEVTSPTSITASWSADAPGATCSAVFSVQDAQGRRSNSERDGRVLLDLQGFPKAPASVFQTAYADGTLTLRVDPGEAQLAYPALAGFVIRWNGQDVAQCSSDGTCPPIAAPNGEQRVYEAYARNSIGTSRTGVRVTAWAYDTPASPSRIQARPVITSGEGGVVSLVIDGIDAGETGTIEVSSPAGETVREPIGPGQTSVELSHYRVGSNTSSPVTVTPYSRFALPPGLGGSPSGAAATVWANGMGAPVDLLLTLGSTSDGDRTSTVTASANATENGEGSSLHYGIVREGERCTTSAGGATASFAGLADGEEYSFTLCVDSIFEGDSYGTSTAVASVRAQQSGAAPTGYTFVVDATPNVSGDRAEWLIRDQPVSDERVPNRNFVNYSGVPSSIFDRDPGIQVQYVHEWWGTATPWATATPRAGSAPYQLQARWNVQSCVGGSDLVTAGSASADTAGGTAAITFGNTGLRYFDATGAELAHEPGTWTVPVGASLVEGIAVSVNWNAQGWGLSPVDTTFSASCDPNSPAPPVQPSP
ncbi:MAG TPA: hypothetical protein VNP97_12390, partial [Microbacterium sp.]|nr:hypothetical protein [Microbacterium sp.]